jgi:replication factor C large subunit
MPPLKRKGNIPWIIKYRPKRVDEVVNQDQAKDVLIPWFKQWVTGRIPPKRAALLYGPPGVGKTSLIEAIANEFKFEMVELNASDYRKASDIRRTVGVAAFRRPLWGNGVIILLDEIDGISPREDAGGLQELLRIIPETRNPIVMTANDPWKDQLRPLREVSLLVEFKQLSKGDIIAVLERICRLEGILCDREGLAYIAEKSEGDVRAAINDLQAVAEGYGKVTLGLVREVVRGRDKKVSLWRTLGDVFYGRYAWAVKRAITNSEEDYETLMAWINDNIPAKYQHPEDLYRAYDALARASLFLNRAKYGGDWSLLSYVFDLMGPGVTFARKHQHGRGRYQYPQRIKLLAQLREVRETRELLASKLASRLLTSKSTVKREILPFLFTIFREAPSPIPAASLALGYGLTEREIKLLAGARYREIVKAIEKIKRKTEPGQPPLRESGSARPPSSESAARSRGREGRSRRRTQRRSWW